MDAGHQKSALNSSAIGVKDLTFMERGRDSTHERTREVESEFSIWARQLVPFLEPNVVIFAAFNQNRFSKLQLLSVVVKLKELNTFESVLSVNFMPHPYFIQVKFESQSVAESFKDMVSEIEGVAVKFVNKSDLLDTCFISLSNLPADLISQYVSPQLATWGSILKIFPQLIPKLNGKNVQVGSTRFEFKFKEGASIADLPYFIKVFNFKVYLYIKGRPKICYRCNSTEHLVSNCSLKFCGVCRGLRQAPHFCTLSYASITSTKADSSQVSTLHDALLVVLDQQLGDKQSAEVEIGDLRGEGCAARNVVGDDPAQNPEPQEKPVKSRSSAKMDGVQQPPQAKRMRTRNISKLELLKSKGVDSSVDTNEVSVKESSVKKKMPKKVKLEEKENKVNSCPTDLGVTLSKPVLGVDVVYVGALQAESQVGTSQSAILQGSNVSSDNENLVSLSSVSSDESDEIEEDNCVQKNELRE